MSKAKIAYNAEKMCGILRVLRKKRLHLEFFVV